MIRIIAKMGAAQMNMGNMEMGIDTGMNMGMGMGYGMGGGFY